jgi:hypothetical protein
MASNRAQPPSDITVTVQQAFCFDAIYTEICPQCGQWTNLGPPDWACRNAACAWSEARFAAEQGERRSKMERWAAYRLTGAQK